MDVARSVTRQFVSTDAEASVSSKMRRRRWQRFLAEFPEIREMRVLDIGGEARFWRHRDVRPAEVTLVNPQTQVVDEPWMRAVAGDGCDLPPGLPEFDLVFSNSVIEHVGGHWRRERFAEQVRGSAPRYWVQTPSRYFPIEPHFLFPFFQHLPRSAQARVAVRWPIGNFRSVKDLSSALDHVLDIELVSASEMRRYFPDAELLTEKVAGLTKSLVAVRRVSGVS